MGPEDVGNENTRGTEGGTTVLDETKKTSLFVHTGLTQIPVPWTKRSETTRVCLKKVPSICLGSFVIRHWTGGEMDDTFRKFIK